MLRNYLKSDLFLLHNRKLLYRGLVYGANFVAEKIEISCIAFCNVHSCVCLLISVSVKVCL